MHSLNLAAKKQGKKSCLRLCFDQIHKKLDYSKRFTDNIGKKINGDFLKKTKGFRPWQFHCFTGI